MDSRPDVPPALDRVVRTSLAKDPEQRYQSMDELRQDLLSAGLSGEPATPSGHETLAPPAPSLQPPLVARRKRRTDLLVGAAVAAIVAAVALLAPRDRPLPSLSEELILATPEPGMHVAPALSPDGNLLAYASDRGEGGDMDIWVKQLGTGQQLQLTFEEGSELDPSFSPDGAWVAYTSHAGAGNIRMVPTLGGEPRLVVAGSRSVARFSPDGQWIAFSRFAEERGGAQIYLVPVAGGPERPIGEFETAFASAWLPGGRLLVTSKDGGEFSTWALNPQTGEAEPHAAYEAFREVGMSRQPRRLRRRGVRRVPHRVSLPQSRRGLSLLEFMDLAALTGGRPTRGHR